MAMMILLYCFVFVAFSCATGLEPTLQDITSIVCPPQRPYICLPYGVCCRGDEFCYQGSCESCFPRSVQEEDLLAWCQDQGAHNVTVMRHDSCGLACYARFNVSVVAKSEAICTQSENTHTELIVVCIVFPLVLIVLVAIIIKLLCRRKRPHETQPIVESLKEVNTNRVNEDLERLETDQPGGVRNVGNSIQLRRETERTGSSSHSQDIELTVPFLNTPTAQV